MTTTPKTLVDLIATGQAHAEIPINEFMTASDILTHPSIITGFTSPPAAPNVSRLYLVGASATGDWVGQDNKLAYYNNGWKFLDHNPSTEQLRWSLTAYDLTNNELISFDPDARLWYPVKDSWQAAEHYTGRRSSSGGLLYAKTINMGEIVGAGANYSITVAHGASVKFTSGSTEAHVTLQCKVRSPTVSFMCPVTIFGANIAPSITSTHAGISIETPFPLTGFYARIRMEYEKP